VVLKEIKMSTPNIRSIIELSTKNSGPASYGGEKDNSKGIKNEL